MGEISQLYFDIINNYQAIAAAIIGVVSAILVSLFQYITTNIIKHNEKKDFEKAIVASIYEELSCLYNGYKKSFEKTILGVKDGNYIIATYSITQDFFTIYHNNASNIGKIKNPEIRNSIVQVYILMKKFIENILFYNSSFSSFLDRRRELICDRHGISGKITFNALYLSDNYICKELSNLLGTEFFDEDYNKNMDNIEEKRITLENFPTELSVFIPNDDCARKDLIKETTTLKEIYSNIKAGIIKTTTMIKKEYNIASSNEILKQVQDDVTLESEMARETANVGN